MDQHAQSYLNNIRINRNWKTEQPFDVIILSHVLEHLTNPIKEIEFLLKMLNMGGCYTWRSQILCIL